jgi:hypothetical protein
MTARPEIGYQPPRVLIVDDERHNSDLLEVMLAPEASPPDCSLKAGPALPNIVYLSTAKHPYPEDT